VKHSIDRIKVLIVDDSAMIRKLVSEILEAEEEFDVVGTAPNPLIAREKIKQLNPDVLTLDVEMPEMNGITFLRNLMRLRPMPVVMLSTLTSKGAESTLEALRIGAVDFVCKPQLGVDRSLEDCAQELVAKVRSAAHSKVRKAYLSHQHNQPDQTARFIEPEAVELTAVDPTNIEKSCLIALGASTGGTEAIRVVLEGLPATAPAIVIAQHIPKEFSRSFAQRMNMVSAMTVHEAEDGQVIQRGHVYIAPGSHHLEVKPHSSGGYCCSLTMDPPVNRHRPSVDVLFDSVIRRVKLKTIGVLLTGMGKDGAQGLLRLKQWKAKTIAQDESSSVIWGMPGEAVKIGGADYVTPLADVAEKIIALAAQSPIRATIHY
jgi:two-component system chemotaxis response regulator CheB